MMTAIRKRAGDFAAIIVLVAIAAVVGGYILEQQRLRFPLIEEKPLRINAEFSTAQAVTPGQGQTVRVAGVQIGDIGSVELRDGQAIVGMDIDPQYREGFVRQDASALLRARTGLKDMFIELNPGTNAAPAAGDGYTIPVNNTLPDVNPDEVLSALDADTRDYLKLLINGAGRGLDRRGSDLQEVFARFEPTYRDIARLTGALSTRRENMRRLVHNLRVLNTELAASGQDFTELIDESAVVLRAFAAEQRGLRSTLRELPPSLRATTVTLGRVHRFADVLRPTADRLRPAVQAIRPANDAVRVLAAAVTPTIRDDIRPFVREAQPLVDDAVRPVNDVAEATPDLRRTFKQLNNLFNLISFNPGGREKTKDSNFTEGFLFWIAWTTHQTEHLFTLNDANGSYRPVFVSSTCAIYKGLIGQFADNPATPAVEGDEDTLGFLLFGFNLIQILADPALCPGSSGFPNQASASSKRSRKEKRREKREREESTVPEAPDPPGVTPEEDSDDGDSDDESENEPKDKPKDLESPAAPDISRLTPPALSPRPPAAAAAARR